MGASVAIKKFRGIYSGTVFVILREKMFILRNFVRLGIAHSEVRNGTEWNGMNSAKK